MSTCNDEIVLIYGESLNVGMNFENALDGATISSITSVVSSPTGITISNQQISDNYVNFKISGGTNGSNYNIVVTIVTSTSETLIGVGKLKVRD